MLFIQSKRYTYEKIDLFLQGKTDDADAADKTILEYLLPLHSLTQKLRDMRLENAFSFRSSEVRMRVDENQKLVSTTVEEETPSMV